MGDAMKLIIEDVPPYSGEYDMDMTFTNRELHRIKTVSEGLRGGEVFDALVAYDTAAFVSVATVVLERTGIIVDTNILWDATSGAIFIDASPNGSDARPPDQQTSDGSSNEPTENEPSSGEPSILPGV